MFPRKKQNLAVLAGLMATPDVRKILENSKKPVVLLTTIGLEDATRIAEEMRALEKLPEPVILVVGYKEKPDEDLSSYVSAFKDMFKPEYIDLPPILSPRPFYAPFIQSGKRDHYKQRKK
ncbi:hypothetical protein KA107_00350 [Candidatus Pacearchaeota archaeon]|nr:hypothetical protein [Candidatus Pacearchaeota archaeon]